ncbi:dioxygenase [Actinomadura spongiicola]|uniref:Dioxygenase n=1 Tax=Actinomadura spongiicola TaxID=2303421 RepID=A0A372GGH3_9ACTN|nr:dioxygenase [Actinomadura spongiicola]RFS84282.1 dioxygenase [Actinomadura spongiicola]
MPEDEQEQLQSGISRKNFIVAAGIGALAVPTAVSVATSAQADTRTPPRKLELTPKCTDGDDDPTPPQTEGPYFSPGSPERKDIRSGKPGTLLTVSGIVYSLDCKPVARALLDFWQADNAGVYDNRGYIFRGHQYTDEQGRYTLTTIVPGLYPGRTRHIHVKVQAPGARILTTQMYFPNEPRNQTDTIYDPRLLMKMGTDQNGRTGNLDFVVRTARRW